MHVTAIRYLSPRPRSFVEGTSPSFALIVCTETTTRSLFYCPKKLCLSLKLVTREKNFPSPTCRGSASFPSSTRGFPPRIICRAGRAYHVGFDIAKLKSKCNFAFARFSVSSIFPIYHACVGVSNYPITNYPPLLVQCILFVPDFHCKSSEIIDGLE